MFTFSASIFVITIYKWHYLEMVIWYAGSLYILSFITEIFEQKMVSFQFDRIEDQWQKFLPVELWEEAVR